MKHLKKFNEELVSRFPQYKRGEVIVFTNRSDADYELVKHLTRKLGYEVVGEYLDDGYVIKVPIGKEKESGQDFVDNYPEFFTSWHREDVKDSYLWDEIEDISKHVQELSDKLGNLNKFGSTMIPKDWNEHIDDVIERLQKIKIDS